MPKWWPLVPAALIVVSNVYCIFRSMLIFDRILKIQYSNHYEQWLASGKPMGFLWVPPECKLSTGSMWNSNSARANVFSLWFSKTPDWLDDDPVSTKQLNWLRFFAVINIVGCYLFILFIICGICFVN